MSNSGGFLGLRNISSHGPGSAKPEVPQPIDPSEWQEHLETCDKTFYSKSKEKLMFNTCLHCLPTGNLSVWGWAVHQLPTVFHTLFGQRWILPVKLTDTFDCDTYKYIYCVSIFCKIYEILSHDIRCWRSWKYAWDFFAARPWHWMQNCDSHGFCVRDSLYKLHLFHQGILFIRIIMDNLLFSRMHVFNGFGWSLYQEQNTVSSWWSPGCLVVFLFILSTWWQH